MFLLANMYDGNPAHNPPDPTAGFFLGQIFATVMVFGTVFALGYATTWWKRRQLAGVIVPGPLLMSMYGGGSLQSMAEGTLEGTNWTYKLLMSGMPMMNGSDDSDNTDFSVKQYDYSDGANAEAGALVAQGLVQISHRAQIIMMVTLPTPSLVHIAAIGQRNGVSQLDPALLIGNGMVPARLEGDFPDYFRLYCDLDHQVELRQVLDPATMAFLIDYCQEYDWEVEANYLYITEADTGTERPARDNTMLLDDAAKFAVRLDKTLKQFGHQPVESAAPMSGA